MSALIQPPLFNTDTATDVFTILAAGSRFHDNPAQIGTRLYEEIEKTSARTIVLRHGACPTGADLIVHEFCESEAAWFEPAGRVLVEDPWPADWDNCGLDCPRIPHRVMKRPGDIHHPGLLGDYCPKAGPRRNQAMAEAVPRPDACLAFPHPQSSGGTASCRRAARRVGIPVDWVRYERPVAS
jgi:hypothetical protein